MVLKYAVMVEYYEAFRAPNPWADNAPAVWNIGACRWGSNKKPDPAKMERARARFQRPRGLWVAIELRDTKFRRVLPDALQDLWWSKQLPNKEVPWALHLLAPLPAPKAGGEDQRDVRMDSSRVTGAVIGLAWFFFFVLSVAGIAKGLGDFVHETGLTGTVVILLIGLGAPLAWLILYLLLNWRHTAKNREVEARVLALLRERAGVQQAPGIQ